MWRKHKMGRMRRVGRKKKLPLRVEIGRDLETHMEKGGK